MIEKPKLSVIMPALNEENNISEAVSKVLMSLEKARLKGEIIVIDDGSRDNTSKIIESKIQENPGLIKMLSHKTPQGIGASFWDGVDSAKGEFAVLMPGDNENNPEEILRYMPLLKEVDIVIPFVFNREVRPLARRILSSFYCFVINRTFLTNFNYTNGTILYRRSLLKELKSRNSGFFFQTDILVRLVKKGYLFAEVPYKLGIRKEGTTKIFRPSSLIKIAKGYFNLVLTFYFANRQKDKRFAEDSITYKKRKLENQEKEFVQNFSPDNIKSGREEKIILDSHKIIWHQDRVRAWLRGERIAPITIDCALTRACTYKCLYCYGQLQANDVKKMTKDVIFRFLDDAAEIGVKAISFVSDGESTCSPHLYDAVLRGKANGLDMALGTNGYLLKDERLAEILPCLTYLRFNISAGEPKRYVEIMGCDERCYFKVINTIKEAVRIKKERNLDVTIGIQMVLMPEFDDQIMPFAELGRNLGVDYAVIKHCSDDEHGSLGVDYSKYFEMTDILKKAESLSNENYLVKAKWSKILSGRKRCYSQCYGPPFIIQLSGSGLVAPCGMLFNDKYKKYHIGNIAEKSFKEIFYSDRYKEVMDLIASDQFDAKTMCGTLCLQHKVNEFLWDLKKGNIELKEAQGNPPMHINFI